MTDWFDEDFDVEAARVTVGKCVLIGLTYVDSFDRLIERVQMYGTISAVSPGGFTIALHGTREGETWTIPPVNEAFEPARPGTYKLLSTGEEIVDPDYLSTWTVQRPPQN